MNVKLVLSASLKVGDVIALDNEETALADLILLSTEDPLGQCYISSSTLDGEKNLKPKLAPKLTQGKLDTNFQIDYDLPNKNIFSFNGILRAGDSSCELSLKQFIPRGSIVKNSSKIYGMVVYAGMETKLALNQG
jgi:magnesium-transporting ATPase (P-type)